MPVSPAPSLGYLRQNKRKQNLESHQCVVSWTPTYLASLPSFSLSESSFICLIYNVQDIELYLGEEQEKVYLLHHPGTRTLKQITTSSFLSSECFFFFLFRASYLIFCLLMPMIIADYFFGKFSFFPPCSLFILPLEFILLFSLQ